MGILAEVIGAVPEKLYNQQKHPAGNMEYFIIGIEGAVATMVAHVVVRRFFPVYSLPNSITLKNSRERISLALLVGIMVVVWLVLHFAVRAVLG